MFVFVFIVGTRHAGSVSVLVVGHGCRVPTMLLFPLTRSFPFSPLFAFAHQATQVRFPLSVFRFYILPPIEGRVGEGS